VCLIGGHAPVTDRGSVDEFLSQDLPPPFTSERHAERKYSLSKERTMQPRYLRCREFALNELQQLLQRPESGQGMVEYALILVLIAIVVIVILTTVGHQINNVFSNISKGLSS
jgi:pilus assembly protein Flp/PilA